MTRANMFEGFEMIFFYNIIGDILVRSDDQGNSSLLNSHRSSILADPDRLWPSGLVEYKFWKSFPTSELPFTFKPT